MRGMAAFHEFGEFEEFVALRRVTGLAAGPDGSRVVVSCQEPDRENARYVSSLWSIDPDGDLPPIRLTQSEKGETGPAFLPDGRLVFASARPYPGQVEDEAALWILPPVGEAQAWAATPGGLGSAVVAATSGTVIASGSRLIGSAGADDDKERRERRRKQKITAIVHDGFPIRYWDHELGDESPRLFGVGTPGVDATGRADDAEAVDLLPDARFELTNADYSISADGTLIATTWRRRGRGGEWTSAVGLVDVAAKRARIVAEAARTDHVAPRISPDGRYVATIAGTNGDFDTPLDYWVHVVAVAGDERVDVRTGDLYPTELAWSADSSTLFISGDLQGSGGLATWRTGDQRPTVILDDAVYGSLAPVSDGSVFALRSAMDSPMQPVRIVLDGGRAVVRHLPTPAPTPELPGRVERICGTAPDGAAVGGWLFVPARAPAAAPVPLQVWIHGGPFMSANSWGWRWCPWVAVARGYAVVLGDPALSTGYGRDWIARAWPHRAGKVWADIEALTDAAGARADVDSTRAACLGGSFGGYLTNWIAGHTDRFAAIVTHAGLWALDQQHTTTDAANWKSGLFATPAEHPDWYAENSPHNFVDRITTPMLVVHGNRDYRVPISEALRLWWDLVSRFDGEPHDLPHRFLQFTGENHWILTPANALLWWQTVQGFVDDHIAGRAANEE
jgi:dipeptidyl aminopeptidase/acylaminoacyl peptidase